MPWHLSRSVPRKVYNSHHQVVCVCTTEAQAALIVKAVNLLPADEVHAVRLREPAISEARQSAVREEESAEVYVPEPGAVTEHSQEVAALQTHEDDPCCSRHLTKALRMGALDTAHDWQCPKCGTDWHSSEQDGVRHWGPDSTVLVMRL